MDKDQLLFETLARYVKEHKVPYKTLSEEMGYSPEHICKVLCGRALLPRTFTKLLIMALCSFIAKDYKDLKSILEGTTWETIFLSLF